MASAWQKLVVEKLMTHASKVRAEAPTPGLGPFTPYSPSAYREAEWQMAG
jgi:hypothetical protein